MRLIPILFCSRAVARRFKPIVGLLPLLLFPDKVGAQGLPVETGSSLPVWIWVAGTAVLGVVLAYGIMRNRGRNRAQRQVTEEATKNLYAEEERDRVNSARLKPERDR
jgi:hypothetical protein